jgi:hypothetical protein
MAITASGLYGLSLEKILIDTLGASLESETVNKCALVLDAYSQNFDTHDFLNDVEANEATGTNYTAGGVVMTGTEVTLASGVLTYDATDVSWASSTIANAMAALGYVEVGASSADPLIFLSDFVTAASTTNGTFTVQWSGSGIWTWDYTP